MSDINDSEFIESKEIEIAKLKIENIELDDKEKFANYDGADQVVPVGELVDKLNRIRKKDFFIRTGMERLEAIVDGFRQGELVVISGVTGNGKTLFARTLTTHFVKNNHLSCWFSYEEDTVELYKKFQLPHFYVPSELKQGKIDWIFERIKEAKVKFGIQAVFIDHLHYITPILSVQNNSLVIGQLMRELKIFAMENRIILFLVAHTSKVNESEAPDLSHLRDSSFIAQEADKVFFVRRKVKLIKDGEQIVDKEYFNNSTVYILKNRRTGRLGKVKFEYKSGMLEEITDYDNI